MAHEEGYRVDTTPINDWNDEILANCVIIDLWLGTEEDHAASFPQLSVSLNRDGRTLVTICATRLLSIDHEIDREEDEIYECIKFERESDWIELETRPYLSLRVGYDSSE